MVAEFNGKLNRIQIKTANEEENGSIKCYCRSSKNHTTNKNFETYEGQTDYFIFYNQNKDLIALVPFEATNGCQVISLRLIPPKNNQSNVRYFSDFSFEKTLNLN
jgi:hypothetical protein